MSDRTRLQKYLAECGVSSRRRAEELICAGRVRVNGRVVTVLGTQVHPEHDEVTVDGSAVQPEKRVLYRFYKPKHVVSTLSDPQGRPSIADYVSGARERLFPVGRLDFDVSGLLLLTNDGDFADTLLHPRYEEPRTYWASVSNELSDKTLQKLTAGIRLKDGRARAVSARRLPKSATRDRLLRSKSGSGDDFIELVVAEGKKHFVKRLLSAAGHPVAELCRVSFASYELGSLRPGEMQQAQFVRRSRGARK